MIIIKIKILTAMYKIENLTLCLWIWKIVQTICTVVWHLLRKIKIYLLFTSSTPHLDIHINELKTAVQTTTGTQTFIATLFTIAQRYNSFNCPSVDE